MTNCSRVTTCSGANSLYNGLLCCMPSAYISYVEGGSSTLVNRCIVLNTVNCLILIDDNGAGRNAPNLVDKSAALISLNTGRTALIDSGYV